MEIYNANLVLLETFFTYLEKGELHGRVFSWICKHKEQEENLFRFNADFTHYFFYMSGYSGGRPIIKRHNLDDCHSPRSAIEQSDKLFKDLVREHDASNPNAS